MASEDLVSVTFCVGWRVGAAWSDLIADLSCDIAARIRQLSEAAEKNSPGSRRVQP